MSRDQVRGFTLIELMVTVAVLAILLAIALPSFQQTLRSNRVATSTNALIGTLALARSEAIRSTHGAAVCSSTNGTACGGSWSDGYLVWADANGDGALAATETVLKFTRGNGDIAITGPGNAVQFDSRGRAAVAVALTLRPPACGSAQLQRKIDVTITGQVKTTKEDCPA
ncbi:GspH/FimT family pseudopilin [Pseudoxanthomonas sp.]|uniref:GspH/FimT family pseudopilin n=1 Tax=Pseudoxanthomonas sp. TaxID=1871049 RepID=UPI002630B12A|nr:GspH/FimT family pseudopilin [Pseudoxanthomonas sp.]WDS36037.1 MAG: GspH/FimT family pseudopilin [Pseudoxanthomonas sp.]